MIVNIFIDSRQKNFIYSNYNAVKKIKNEINIILLNDLSNDKEIIEKGYIVYSLKHIVKDNIFYEIYIYYIPKFWSLYSLNIKNNIISQKNETLLINKINEFILKINELNKSNKKSNNSFKSGKKTTFFLEFEYDLFILKKITSIINQVNIKKEKTFAFSDIIIGDINYDINHFNNDSAITAQNIYVKNKKIYSFINSYLHCKFNHKYLSFLNESKKSQNTVFKDLLREIKHIKIKTNYDKQSFFLTKDLLRGTLQQSNNKKIHNDNRKLFNYLDLLVINKVNISKNKHYRKFFMMDRIWEIYVEKNLILYGDINKIQDDKKFIVNSFHQNDCRYSRPDLISNISVIDAKYKHLNTSNGVIKNIDMSDINKLIRDLIFNSKNKGVLVFPMTIDITDNINNHYTKHSYELLEGLKEYSIDIIELYFK